MFVVQGVRSLDFHNYVVCGLQQLMLTSDRARHSAILMMQKHIDVASFWFVFKVLVSSRHTDLMAQEQLLQLLLCIVFLRCVCS